MEFNVNFEKLILSLSLKDKAFFLKTLMITHPNMFSDTDNKNVYVELIKFYQKHKQLPDKEYFISTPPSFLNELYKERQIKEQTKIELLDKVEEWVKRKKLVEAIHESVEKIKTGEYEGLDTLIRDALKVSINTDIGIDYFKDTTRIDDYEDTEYSKLRFTENYKVFERIIGGGIARKALGIVQAKSNLGKCSKGDTKITVRDKKTGEIFEIELEEVYKKYA